MTKSGYISGPSRFSRQWWFEGMHTAFWVIAVTVLVWVYADREYTGEMNIKARIRLTVGKNDRVTLTHSSDVPVDFKVRGYNKVLEQFKRRLIRDSMIEYDVSDLGAGDHEIEPAEILKSTPGLEKARLVVLSSSMKAIPFTLEELQERTLQVSFESVGATPVKGSIQIDPPQIAVRATVAAWAKIDLAEDSPKLRTVQMDLQGTAAGTRQETLNIVPIIAGEPVRPEVTQVTVTFEISERTGKEQIPIAVRVLDPPLWLEDGTWSRYTLNRKDHSEWLPQITVRGPRIDLDKIRARKSEIDAYVALTEDDKKPIKSWLARKVTIRFPDDLDVSLVGPAPIVNFRLVKLPSAPSEP
ncbi:MAG: hypothetical protein J7M14_06250 [Planctomycetes bacterium]|nr:hypothetical protein [Planctomycetota bacterium]